MISYRINRGGTVQAAYSGTVRIGYIDRADEDRWLWSLNMIQPGGGRANGIETSEQKAKQAMTDALVKWVEAAGLKFAYAEAQIAVER